MDGLIFGTKTLNTPRPRVDRFVVPRESFPEMRRRIQWPRNVVNPEYDIWHRKYLKQKIYMNYVNEAFGLDPPRVMSKAGESPTLLKGWPCRPRKKNFLSSADSVLDLPTYSYAVFPEILDWSNNNILVAALGNHYHKWSWKTQTIMSQGYTEEEIFCCKFDPRAELLLLGSDSETVEIHDNELSKWLSSMYCPCRHINQYCTITAIDWSPTGKSFVMGCAGGVLCSVSRDAKLISWRQLFEDPLLAVRVSPDTRYVAAAAINGDTIRILTWPGLTLYSNVKSSWTVKALAWHPWRSALLGVGAVSFNNHARIAVWDVPSNKIQESDVGNFESLDCMLFSKRTGELVVSLSNIDTETDILNASSQLLVMSGPKTVVDQWGEGRNCLDRVRTMVFNPDGTKLATATKDEDLIIWNFLPEDHNNKKLACRKFSAMPVFFDETTHGFSLR